jgi:PAS domain-containing protein
MRTRLLILCVLLGLAASCLILVDRVRLEARHRIVEIVLDGDDWQGLIRREGRASREVLRALRERGAVSVALGDNTLRRLADEGVISYASGGEVATQGRLGTLHPAFARLHEARQLRADAVYATGDAGDRAFVAGRFRALLGAARVREIGAVLEVLGGRADLEEIGLGFRPTDAARFREAGLGVVLRPRNYRGLTPESLRTLVDSYAATSPEPILIFAATEVQGYQGLLDSAATEYQRVGARYGRIEVFSERRKQRGEDGLTALMRPNVIRVFSITPEELQVLRAPDVADRFVRAAQERNIRILYVRPLLFTPAGIPALQANLNLVEAISAELRRFGFTPARARPLAPLEPAQPLIWIVSLGAAALGVLVLDRAARAAGLAIPPWMWWAAIALIVLGTGAAGLTRFDSLSRRLLALGVATTGAAGAVIWALPSAPWGNRSAIAAAWGTLLRAVGLAVVPALFVAALLSQWSFMHAFSIFLGVKLAHAVPVGLVVVWMLLEARRTLGWRGVGDAVGQWVQQPLRYGTAAAAIGVIIIAAILLARTGNISAPISGTEQQLRAALEDLLVARPRTKEFLVGYPMLALAGLAAARGWHRVTIGFAAAGVVGTSGVINSFSHLHTPLLYTLWRTANALGLGALLAIPAVVVILWIGRRLRLS